MDGKCTNMEIQGIEVNENTHAKNGSDIENSRCSNREREILNNDFGEDVERSKYSEAKSEDKNRNLNKHSNQNNCEETKSWSTDLKECSGSERNVEENPVGKRKKYVKDEIDSEGKWIVRTYTGYIVTINMHPDSDRPIQFESERAQLMWDVATEINLTRFKHQIQTGEYIPDHASVEIDPNPLKAPADKCAYFTEKLQSEQERLENVINRKNTKIKLYTDELGLVELILKIRDSFSGEGNMEAGLNLMDEILKIDISPLMLKKYPIVVNTIYCLCRYEGMNEQSNTDSSIAHVKAKAQEIYNKFQSLFSVPVNSTFEDYFKEQYKLMRKMCGYDESRIYELINDPTAIFLR